MQEKLKLIRGSDETEITFIDTGQISEVKKSGNRFHESTMLEAISRLDIKKGVFLDIGAHVGNHSIFFAKYCSQCTEVMSYELSDITFNTLFDNTLPYKNITARNMALGSRIGSCSVDHNILRPGQSKIGYGREIPMITIDNIPLYFPLSLVKIDVEGNEFDVLQGGKNTFIEHKPEIFIETFGDPNLLLSFLPEGYKIIKRYNNAPTYHLSWRS